MTSKPNLKQSETISRLSGTARQIQQKPIDNQQVIQSLLGELRSVKERLKALKQQEDAILANLTDLFSSGLMDDAKDCGEDRWLGNGITLTRQTRQGGWDYSEPCANRIKELQAADIESGAAVRKPESHYWRANLAN